MESLTKSSASDHKSYYRLNMKLVQVTYTSAGRTNTSIWCNKKIALKDLHAEIDSMVGRLVSKITKKVTP